MVLLLPELLLPEQIMKTHILLLSLVAVLAASSTWAQQHDETYSNRLIDSQDPYLLLHAHNPVDWYPWGPEALEKARRENKPIFISVGYSTCYWCHVAEREIYSNPDIAKLMNQWFVNIKIDREQRPDLDSIYMRATQVLTGHGGWPNNVFLTPDLKPFYAGSYFPPEDQQGRPGFPQILKRIHQAWEQDQERILKVADSVFEKLQPTALAGPVAGTGLPGTDIWLEQAVLQAASSFDDLQGGFGNGPTKFPKAPMLAMLLSAYTEAQWTNARDMVRITLEAMAAGGVMDQLAGGFHRYSTEPGWSIPHFEKMLYDNAQLLGVYAKAYEATGGEMLRQAALSTAHYLRTEMQAPGGGFYSAQDAEVDGVEGASYVWTRKEIDTVLGAAEARQFFGHYELVSMPSAPFGHQQPTGGALRLKIDKTSSDDKLTTAAIQTLESSRDKLLAVRQKRKQVARDEKIVMADNALTIIGFTQAGQSLQQPDLSKTAQKTANWIWKNAFDSKSGELLHQIFQDKAGGPGFLDDYALVGQAFMGLYHSTGKKRWRSRAQKLTDAMLDRFARPDGMLVSSWDNIDLVVSPPEQGDSVKPSGQSAAISLLLQVSAATGEQRYAIAAYQAILPLYTRVNGNPSAWGTLLVGLSNVNQYAALETASKSELPQFKGPMLDSSDYVHVRGYWSKMPDALELTLTIKVDAGYHINANPASDPLLIPTQLILAGHPELTVAYPPLKTFNATFAPQGIDVYEGRITLKTQLPKTEATVQPPASLRVQACNHEVCFAPSTIPVLVSGTKN